MKRFFNLLPLIGRLSLLGLVALSPLSCADQFDFSKVDDPALTGTRGNGTCQLIIVGRVTDARTGQPIKDAAIQLFDAATISDSDGMYRIEVKDPKDDIDVTRLMWAFRPGFELDTYQFIPSEWVMGDCENSITYICVDFVMSRKGTTFTVSPTGGGGVTMSDTTLFVTQDENEGLKVDTIISKVTLSIPPGAVNATTDFTLSVYAKQSYVGSTDSIELNQPLLRFRLSSEPMINLNENFTLTFVPEHPTAFNPNDANKLLVFRFHDINHPFQGFHLPSNLWRKHTDAVVNFNPMANLIGVRSKVLGSYMVQNQANPLTFVAGHSYGPVTSLINLNNCDCTEALYLNYGVRIDGRMQHVGIPAMSLKDRLIYLNDLKVLTNTPFSSLSELLKLGGPNAFNQFIPGPDKVLTDKVLLPKCRQLYVDSRPVMQGASGIQYGLNYSLQRSIGTQILFKQLLCPTTSSCHQGCP